MFSSSAALRVRAALRHEVAELNGKALTALRVEAIDALPAVALLNEKARSREDPQMMGDRGLGEREALGHLGYVEALSREHRNDLLAGWIGKGPEHPTQGIEVYAFDHTLASS
jgi:hypothetical protein